MKIGRWGVAAMCLALLMGGCTRPAPQPDLTPTEVSTPTPPPIVRPTIPEDFVARIDGSTATIPLATAALQLLRGTDAGLHFNTTPDAYDNLIAGDKDLIIVTAPSQEELDAASQAGVELEVIPIVKDALAFLVNSANPVDTLTQQQVRDIYTGTITNWNQVGGLDAPIFAYQRQINSGSQTLFLQLAMGDVTPMDAPSELRPQDMGSLVDAISVYDNAQTSIGYSMFYYTQQMYVKDNVKLLAIDGISPTDETISDETYPYLTYYYAVVRQTEPENSVGRQLIDWLLTWDGQRMASGTGYVPLEPANIVEMRQEYGYAGSTQDNTTNSSGTGGPIGQIPADTEDPCVDQCLSWDEDGTITDVTVPGFPQAETTIKAWIGNLDPAPTYTSATMMCDADPCQSRVVWMTYSNNGLLIATRIVDLPTGTSRGYTVTYDSAVVRLSDGHRLTLSDLFYDGVNYIDFINTNLLNTDTNQALADCIVALLGICTVGDMKAPFTGLPSTYDLFSLSFQEIQGQPQLTLKLPSGNPFLSFEAPYDSSQILDSFVPINLPADLSPYGLIWRYDRVTVGDMQTQHIARNYGSPSPIDDIINQGIDDFLSQYPDMYSLDFSVSDGVVSVGGLGPDGADCMAQFDYATGERLQ